MRQLLTLATWMMLAGIVLIPLLDMFLTARKKARMGVPTGRSEYENWILWWLLENHPNAKRGRPKT